MQSKLPDQGTTIFTVMSDLANRHHALNMSQGFPNYDPPQELRAALAEAALASHHQYAPMSGLDILREQISGKLQRFYQVDADPDTEITVTPGATEAIYCAITATVRNGDEVIVFDPCYDSYEPAILLAGGSARHIAMQPPEFTIDWDQVAAAINGRTRMIIVNTPHNPSGAVLSHEDMLALEALVAEREIYVLSDEVYEHLVFDGRQHRSVLQYPRLRECSFATFSFGKTYHITGWKTGYCVAPPSLTNELRKVHQFVSYVAVTPIQQALARFMISQPEFPASLAGFYQEKRDLFCALLSGSRFSLSPAQGTYFQLLDYSGITAEPDTELATRLTREAGIASIPVSIFCAAPPGGRYLRFCFAKSTEFLKQGAEILCRI